MLVTQPAKRRHFSYVTKGTITVALLPYLLPAALIAVMFYARKRSKEKLDAEFRTALSALNVEQYELLVDKVVTPSTDRTAEVYRMVRDDQDRYFLYLKVGSSPGVLQPLAKERALLAVQANG